MLSKYLTSLLSVVLFLFAIESQAGIIIGSTRIIYEGDKKETAISIKNLDKTPYLIQSWLDDEQGATLSKKTQPFIITPPLFRLNGDSANALRIVKIGHLPDNRESVYWLNIKSIPTSDPNAKNELHISVNSRIKLFYRPALLSSQDALLAYKKMTFQRNGDALFAKNPTPFYLSLSELDVNGVAISNPGMVAPFSEQRWALPVKSTVGPLKVKWSTINDYGGRTDPETQM
ncbi:fimbrial biogenesis chaperone [Providencia sp.]|uniref:fimbrial biogenesis chaperone n=1 Tax=Providencia sp. TaxID=589 RepID=UPI003F98CDF7